MVKEIGMRVGGPSESQVRGMRSEGEMGERVREETAATQIQQEEKDKRHNEKRKRNERAGTSSDMKAAWEPKPVCAA